MIKCSHSKILSLVTIFIIGCLCLINADYSIPDASIMRIEPITDVKIIATEKNNLDILASDREGVKFIRPKSDTLSSSAPFGNSIGVECKLFEQDFRLQLYLDTKVISSETTLFVNGEYVDQQPNFFTYTSTFIYDDGGIGYASFTIIPVDDNRLSIDGVVVKDGETYHVEHIRVHEVLIEKTRNQKSQQLATEEFIVASYVSNGEPVDPINQQNIQRLNRDLVILDKEWERLKTAKAEASHKLIGFRLGDLKGLESQGSHELCHELYPDFEDYKASLGEDDDDSGDTLASTLLDGAEDQVRRILGDVGDSDKKGGKEAKTKSKKQKAKKVKTLDHHHDHHDHDHHHHHPKQQKQQQRTSSVLSLTETRKNYHAHYIPFQHLSPAHHAQPNPLASLSETGTAASATTFTFGPQEHAELLEILQHTTNDDDVGHNTHHNLNHRDNAVYSAIDIQPSPLGRSPLLSRWSDCHPYASKGTTLIKVNLLVTYGTSVFLTGSSNPTTEGVVAALTTLVSKANGPLFIQLGMKIALSNLFIMTTPDRSKVPWNFGGKGEPNSGCPETAFEVIYLVKDARTDKKNPLPPAAITHLLTTCYDQGVVGQAYVGGMRHHEFSTGWASLRDSSSWTTFLHEILHSIGASHPFNNDATTAGTYGGIMDYGKGEVEGVLISGPYAGQIGLNIDSDYEKLCSSLQTRGFSETDDTLFPLQESFSFITGGWLCRKGEGTLETDPLRSCSDTTTWGKCSGSCGVGQTKRVVVCTNDDGKQVKNSECDETQPPSERECQDTSQCSEMVYGWKCGKRLTDLRKPSSSLNCQGDDDTENTWSACSSLCGEGKQTRVRKCGTSFDTWVDDQLCVDHLEELAPSLERPCYSDQTCSFTWVCADSTVTLATASPTNTGQCANDSFYTTTCSNTCGSGEYTRAVFCLRSGTFLAPSECSSIADTRPAASKPCSSTSKCDYSWMCRDKTDPRKFVDCTVKASDSGGGASYDLSNWSPCSSKKCGERGTQTREVVCLRENDATVMSDESRCEAKDKPPISRTCTKPCGGGDGDDGDGDGDSDHQSGDDDSNVIDHSDSDGDDTPSQQLKYVWRCAPYSTINGYEDTYDCDGAGAGAGAGTGGFTECITPLCSQLQSDSDGSDDSGQAGDASLKKPITADGEQLRYLYCFSIADKHTMVRDGLCTTEKPNEKTECRGPCSQYNSEQNRVRYQWAVIESKLCCYNNNQMIDALNDILDDDNNNNNNTTAPDGDVKQVTLSTDQGVIRQYIVDHLDWFTEANIAKYGIRQEQVLMCLDTMTRKIVKDALCKTQKDSDSPTGLLIKPPTTRQCSKGLITKCASSNEADYYDDLFRHPETNIIPPGGTNHTPQPPQIHILAMMSMVIVFSILMLMIPHIY